MLQHLLHFAFKKLTKHEGVDKDKVIKPSWINKGERMKINYFKWNDNTNKIGQLQLSLL